MAERLYEEHPELYDAIQSEWDYDRDVAFVEAHLERAGLAGTNVLEIGCGTGEHTRRLITAGFDVTAVDRSSGMLDVARGKCDADFRHTALPDLDVDDSYDAVVMIRGVVNHLPPEALPAAVEAIESRLVDDGILVFDNSPLPPNGNHPAIDVGTMDGDAYARIAQHVLMADGRLDWRSVTFTPEGSFFVDRCAMTPFTDEEIVAELERSGFSVELYDGFGAGDERTVFVASPG